MQNKLKKLKMQRIPLTAHQPTNVGVVDESQVEIISELFFQTETPHIWFCCFECELVVLETRKEKKRK